MSERKNHASGQIFKGQPRHQAPHPRNEVADAGRVLVNGKPAKASYTVKIGDIIEVTFGNRPVKIRVLSDVEQKGKYIARERFEVIEG